MQRDLRPVWLQGSSVEAVEWHGSHCTSHSAVCPRVCASHDVHAEMLRDLLRLEQEAKANSKMTTIQTVTVTRSLCTVHDCARPVSCSLVLFLRWCGRAPRSFLLPKIVSGNVDVGASSRLNLSNLQCSGNGSNTRKRQKREGRPSFARRRRQCDRVRRR